MIKKPLAILGGVLILLLALVGCASNTKEPTQYNTALYSITVEDGRYLLTPKDTTDPVNTSKVFLYPQFSSVAEMRQGIITGSYMEDIYAEVYLESLTRRSGNTDGTIEICNLENLYECVMPSGMKLKNVVWRGDSYYFNFTSETVWGAVYCCDEDAVQTEMVYKDFLSNPLVKITKQEAVEERGAEVYYYATSVAELKAICYEIREGEKRIFIQETYVLGGDCDLEKSSTVPLRIQFWGTDNSGWFYGGLHGLTERPSVEWLSQFGLKDYVETE